jgi:plasmid stabilization system protein ParE
VARAVVVQRRATTDLAGIVRSIVRRVSLAAARRWRHQIEGVIDALAADADQWPEADEAADLGVDLRCRLFGRRPHVYRVLFTIDGNTVYVHHVRHAAQDRLTADDL